MPACDLVDCAIGDVKLSKLLAPCSYRQFSYDTTWKASVLLDINRGRGTDDAFVLRVGSRTGRPTSPGTPSANVLLDGVNNNDEFNAVVGQRAPFD